MNLRKNMKDLKVKHKMNLNMIIMIVIIVLLGGVTFLLSREMYNSVKEITEIWSPSLAHVQELDKLTSDYRRKQYGHLVSEEEAEMKDYERQLSELDQEIQAISIELKEVITLDEEQKLYENVEDKWKIYKEQSKPLLELSYASKTEEGGKMMLGELFTTFNDFNASFEELKTLEQNALELAKQNVNKMFILMIWAILIMSILAIVIAVLMSRKITKLITEPLKQITEAATRMYQGDMSVGELLTYEAEDELGIVAASLQGAMRNLQSYIEEISTILREIAKGDLTKDSEEITDFLGDFASIKESFIYILKRFNSTLTDIQESSDQVSSNASEIASASQSLSEGAIDQAGAIEELKTSIITVAKFSEESAKNARETYTKMKESADHAEIEKEKVEELTREMRRIKDISKEIENISTTIESIASQTNLLSLNAAIEAARAGNAGKGFAVVAEQIGRLAADSAKSAVNTRELIGKTIEEIEKGNEITISTSETFERIIEEMKEFSEETHITNEKANSQAESLLQIENRIEQISGIVQHNASASEESTAISENLSEEALKLDKLVKRFKLYN